MGGTSLAAGCRRWASYSCDDSSFSVQGQRYASDGTAAGSEFQVNTYTTFGQTLPAVAVGPAGEFVVVWQSSGSNGSDESFYSVQGQRYASDGTAAGSEFQVNTYTTYSQRNAAVGVGPVGELVVVWESAGSGGSDSYGYSIQGQRYASDGTGLGSEFQINTYPTGSQSAPAVAVGSDGAFVVVWRSPGSDGSDDSGSSIQGQRYASDGTAVATEFQVNTYTTSDQNGPAVGVGPDGGFVAAWESSGSSGSDTSEFSIQGQRYASDGTAVATEFQVNSYTSSDQLVPAVAVGPGGEFVVVWQSSGSSGSDTSYTSIQGQRYTSDATPVGSELQVNTYTDSYQRSPAVAMGPDGSFVVVWDSLGSSGSDNSFESVQALRFARFAGLIFADGFESGNTNAWSSVVP